VSRRPKRRVRVVDIATMLCFCDTSGCPCDLVRDARMTPESVARFLVQHASQGGLRAAG